MSKTKNIKSQNPKAQNAGKENLDAAANASLGARLFAYLMDGAILLVYLALLFGLFFLLANLDASEQVALIVFFVTFTPVLFYDLIFEYIFQHFVGITSVYGYPLPP